MNDDAGDTPFAADYFTPSAAQLDWDDDRLLVREDARRRLYRRLQSWYRQERLHAPYGWTKAQPETTKRRAIPARPVGSRLDPTWAEAHPNANFLPNCELSEAILAYVNSRKDAVQRLGGTLEPVRLRTNLLSSMPLCFNLFAPLRTHPDVALTLLQRGFGVDAVELVSIAGIDSIECEWAPPPGAGIGDRTAFDAVVAYRTSDNATCLLGVETKYTEPFSTTQYGRPDEPTQAKRRASYLQWTQAGWFRPGAEDRLFRPATNQLWRSSMLGAACERLPGVDRVDVAVAALYADPHADAAVAGVRADMEDPMRLLYVPLERIARLCDGGPLHRWAELFRERYLDTTPVTRANSEDRDRLQRRLDGLFPEGSRVAYDIGAEEPYEFHCPHPVVRLVDGRLELYLWREDNWAGNYPVVNQIEAATPTGPSLCFDGGRFVLSAVDDPEARRAMSALRLTSEAFLNARDQPTS